jgi:hypothetical protein
MTYIVMIMLPTGNLRVEAVRKELSMLTKCPSGLAIEEQAKLKQSKS